MLSITGTYKYRQLIKQPTARTNFRNNSLKNTQTNYKNKQKIMNDRFAESSYTVIPVLGGVAPPLRRGAAAGGVLQITKACPNWPVCWCLWASTSTACISTPNTVRHDICRHNYAVDRGLVVGFCCQPHYCCRPYYLTARFRSLSSYTVSGEPFPDGSGPMSCWLAQMGSRPITFLWLWPATDHEPHCWHVPTGKVSGWTESAPSRADDA